jgi:hypothetical protein
MITVCALTLACSDRFSERLDAPVLGPQFSEEDEECSQSVSIHPANADGGVTPASTLIGTVECRKVRSAISVLRANPSAFCQGLADWADYFMLAQRFSKWSWISSHHHDNGGGAYDTIVIHTDHLGASAQVLAAKLAHEIMHSQEWGISHFTSPNNGELEDYCVTGQGPTPPPAPQAPGL